MGTFRIIFVTVVAVFFSIAASAADSVENKTGGPWKLGEVVVEQAWARVTPGGSRTAAIYLTIHNKAATDDLLLAVDSSAARTTAIHESRIVDGVATMEPLPVGLPMPSHGEVVMRPSAIHIMLTGLSDTFKVGEMLPVRMVFQEAGSLDFEVPILPFNTVDPAVKHSGHGTSP